MNLTSEFNQRGFVRARLFDRDLLDQMRIDVISVLGSDVSSFDQARRDLAVAYTEPDLAGELVGRVRLLAGLPTLMRTAGQFSLVERVKALGLNNPILSSAPEMRTDFPEDNRYAQQLHQDWPYTQTSLNAVTIWTPLHDVKSTDGALTVIPCSHKAGLLPPTVEVNPRKFLVRADLWEGLEVEAQTVEVEFGESLIFSQFLVHASGRNTSPRVRISFQVRFADLDEGAWRASNFAKADLTTTSVRALGPSPM